jgi:hypothetical protein
MRLINGFILTVALLAVCGVAGASVTFDMGAGSSIDVNNTAGGLEMWANVASLDGEVFTLNAGSSHTFHFASMGTHEDAINSDDLIPRDVFAYLDFEFPDLTGSVDGTSVGFAGGLNFDQGWDLVWNDPVFVDFGVGGRFSIDLSNASVRNGWWTGPDGVNNSHDDICATITLVSEPTPGKIDPVPEPTSMALLAMGLGGLVIRRRFVA